MRANIQKLDEMTDSREVLEARTHPVITVFITVVILLLAAGLVWGYLGEIDDVAKASGVVRPNDKVSSIQASVFGTIDMVHVREGERVQAGDLLVTLEQQELRLELDSREAELIRLERELDDLGRYHQSIEQRSNLFAQGVQEEQFYYTLVEQFLLDMDSRRSDYSSRLIQMEQELERTVQSRTFIDLERRSSLQKVEQSQEQYERRITELETELEGERLLLQSIQNGARGAAPMDTLREERLAQFELRVQQLQQSIAESRSLYEQSVALGERFVAKAKLEEQQAAVESRELQLKEHVQQAILEVQGHIEAYEKEIKDTNRSLALLYAKDAPSVLEQETLELEETKLEGERSRLNKQNQLLKAASSTELEKFRLDRLVQIQGLMEEKKGARRMLAEKVEQLRLELDKQQLSSPIEGYVHVLKEVSTGSIVQPGEVILSIIPKEESMYKINMAMPNHEVGKIKVGDQVDLNFHAFPKQSFGSLPGSVTSISTDAVIQDDGRSYYIVEASIANAPLVNRKGERGEIRVGMTVEAYVITDSKRIIDYILEKINLKE